LHQQQQKRKDEPATDSESITLSDDSLNEFELKEDEYQSPYIIPTMPRLPASLLRPLNDDEDEEDDVILDSLTTEKPPRTASASGATYPDSLNRPNSRGLFDSMASMEEEEEKRPRRRLIQPYMDNSLSTGSYTSEQEEEEETRGLVLQHHNNINVKVHIKLRNFLFYAWKSKEIIVKFPLFFQQFFMDFAKLLEF